MIVEENESCEMASKMRCGDMFRPSPCRAVVFLGIEFLIISPLIIARDMFFVCMRTIEIGVLFKLMLPKLKCS